jgi:cell division protein FtsQ
MLGKFIYSETDSDDIAADTVARAETPQFAVPGKFEKGVKRFLLLASIFICMGLIWLFAISPCKAFTLVEVKGFPGFEKEAVLNYAGIDSSASYVSVNAGDVQRLLASHHMVESAKVIKRFPDRLSIFLEPRQAVAAILADVNGVKRSVYIDRHGVPFAIGNGAGQKQPYWLPVVSGIPVGTSRLGTPLSAVFAPLFAQIGMINDEAPELWRAVSEIKVVRMDYGKYELVLFPLKYPVRLRMGDELSKESLRYALLMLDVIRRGDTVPDEIDVRSGIGVVKAKEVHFGE